MMLVEPRQYMNGGFGPRPAATSSFLSLLQNRQRCGSAVLPGHPASRGELRRKLSPEALKAVKLSV